MKVLGELACERVLLRQSSGMSDVVKTLQGVIFLGNHRLNRQQMLIARTHKEFKQGWYYASLKYCDLVKVNTKIKDIK